MKKTAALLLTILLLGDSANFPLGASNSSWTIRHAMQNIVPCSYGAEAVPPQALIAAHFSHLSKAFFILAQIAALAGFAALVLTPSLAAQTNGSAASSGSKSGRSAGAALPKKTLQTIKSAIEKLESQKQTTQKTLDQFAQALQKTVEAYHAAVPIPEELNQRADVSQRIVESLALSWASESATSNSAGPESMQNLRQALTELRNQLQPLQAARDTAFALMAGVNPKSREYTFLKTDFDMKYKVAEELRLKASAQMTRYVLAKGAPPQVIYESRYYLVSATYTGDGQGTVLIFKGQQQLLPRGVQLQLELIGRRFDLSSFSTIRLITDDVPFGDPYTSDVTLKEAIDKFDISASVQQIFGAGAANAWPKLNLGPNQAGAAAVATPAPPALTATAVGSPEAFQRLLAWYRPNDAAALTTWLTKQNVSAPDAMETMANIMDIMAQTATLRENTALSIREIYLTQSSQVVVDLRSKYPAPADREKLVLETRRLKMDQATINDQYQKVPLLPYETNPAFLARLIENEISRRMKVPAESVPSPLASPGVSEGKGPENAKVPALAPTTPKLDKEWITAANNSIEILQKTLSALQKELGASIGPIKKAVSDAVTAKNLVATTQVLTSWSDKLAKVMEDAKTKQQAARMAVKNLQDAGGKAPSSWVSLENKSSEAIAEAARRIEEIKRALVLANPTAQAAPVGPPSPDLSAPNEGAPIFKAAPAGTTRDSTGFLHRDGNGKVQAAPYVVSVLILALTPSVGWLIDLLGISWAIGLFALVFFPRELHYAWSYVRSPFQRAVRSWPKAFLSERVWAAA
jgi:hypothetical protein